MPIVNHPQVGWHIDITQYSRLEVGELRWTEVTKKVFFKPAHY